MKIQLWSIGKANEDYVRQGVTLFGERLRRYTDFELVIIPGLKNASGLSPAELQKKEAERVTDMLLPGDYLVALDEHGPAFSTEELSSFLQQRMNTGTARLIFLIGGAYGIDTSLLNKARQQISLSRLTFPHQLVRLIATEQLYRAFTILRNEKYHHQ